MRRVKILSVDALPYFLLERYLKEWDLKNFQRLKQESAFAQGMIAQGPDATTPSAHAQLFCGCPSITNGIYSFEEPAIDKGVIHPWRKRFGFSAERLNAEPIWVSFLRAGKRVVMFHFPLSVPIEPYTQSKKFGENFQDRLIVLEGFSQRLGFETVKDNQESSASFQHSISEQIKIELPVKAPESMDQVFIKDKNAGLIRMRFASENNLEPELYFISSVHQILSNHQEVAREYLEKVGAFNSSGAVYSYYQGKLGKQIYKGGTGLAEKRLCVSLELMAEHFYNAIKFSIEQLESEVGFYYFHGVDLVLHLWMGYLDSAGSGGSPEIREVLLPVVRRMFEWADKIVGLLLSASDDEDLVVVVSDHGMAPIETLFYPNQVLESKGYLVWNQQKGEPDFEQSQVVYHPSNSGYIVINTKERGGIVPEKSAQELSQEIAQVFAEYLGSALDKIELVWKNPEIPPLGEIYLIPKYKIGLSPKLEGKILEKGAYGGQHHYWSESEPMSAILFFKGKMVPKGKNLGIRNHLELAKTIAMLAGIEPPAKAIAGPIKF